VRRHIVLPFATDLCLSRRIAFPLSIILVLSLKRRHPTRSRQLRCRSQSKIPSCSSGTRGWENRTSGATGSISIADEHLSSRLVGIFVFGSVEDVSAVWEAEGWPSHFKNENLTDCGVQACRKSRVDANWIPFIFDQNDNLTEDWIGSVRRYWQGEEAPGKPPAWETIVSGCLTLWGTDVKDRARKELCQYFSSSQHAWSYSEICFDVGSFDGTFVSVAVPDSQKLTIEDRFLTKDLARTSFRDGLREGKTGLSGKLRTFGGFDRIQWPKLDLSETHISLSELQKALQAAKAGMFL